MAALSTTGTASQSLYSILRLMQCLSAMTVFLDIKIAYTGGQLNRIIENILKNLFEILVQENLIEK